MPYIFGIHSDILSRKYSKQEEEKETRDGKSNNPHLTGGEKLQSTLSSTMLLPSPPGTWPTQLTAHIFQKKRHGFVPQQRKLMGSSAQNNSGVPWCRRRVRFNEVPEKVPEKVWETLVQR